MFRSRWCWRIRLPEASEIAASFQLSPLFRDPHDQINGRGSGADAVGQGRRHRAGAGPTSRADRRGATPLSRFWSTASTATPRGSSRPTPKPRSHSRAPGSPPKAWTTAAAGGQAVVESQLWFNSANDSRYFLVPGLIVLIITLIGAFMTSMVVAREWERGTFEALFVTPVRTDEILLGQDRPLLLAGHGRPAVVHGVGEVPV